jgi:mono/diheme cytochrome c family protein
MRFMSVGTIAALCLAFSSTSIVHAAAVPTFEKDIGPLLVKRCATCHGDKRQKKELRLDSAEGVKKGSEDGPIYIAGNADMSEIVRRTTLTEGDSERMPAKGQMLSKAETDAIKAWINAGAKFD